MTVCYDNDASDVSSPHDLCDSLNMRDLISSSFKTTMTPMTTTLAQ